MSQSALLVSRSTSRCDNLPFPQCSNAAVSVLGRPLLTVLCTCTLTPPSVDGHKMLPKNAADMRVCAASSFINLVCSKAGDLV